jgi:hypothetical protein
MNGVFWIYRNIVCRLDSNEPEHMRDPATDALLIKHHVLHREHDDERVRREVEALKIWKSWKARRASRFLKRCVFSCGNATAANV